MKKFGSIIVALLAVLLLLTGCDSVADETKIQTDLSTFTQSEVLDLGEQIQSLEIIKRQTEKEYKRDIVWCEFVTEDEDCRYEKSAILTYTLYDEGGWILDNVSLSDRLEWVITPLAGITDGKITESVQESKLSITDENDETWTISEDSIKSLTIENHETDLEAFTDTVTVSLVLHDSVEEANGTITVKYYFNTISGEWETESTEKDSKFAVSQVTGTELKVTEEDVKKAVNGKTYSFGNESQSAWYYVSKEDREITINEKEIQNVKITKDEVSNFGKTHIYSCEFDLVKSLAKFHVTTEIPYHYQEDSGWKAGTIDFAVKCTSADITGEWKGSYDGSAAEGNGTCTLTLQLSADGKLTGEYAFRADSGYYIGSYKVEGEFDEETLHVVLSAGDWVDNTEVRNWIKDDISADLYPDNSTLIGNGHNEVKFQLVKK